MVEGLTVTIMDVHKQGVAHAISCHCFETEQRISGFCSAQNENISEAISGGIPLLIMSMIDRCW